MTATTTPAADLDAITAAIAYLRHIGINRIGRANQQEMERAVTFSDAASAALNRIRAELVTAPADTDEAATGCTVAGAA